MNFNKKNTWNQLKEALGSDITFGGKKEKTMVKENKYQFEFTKGKTMGYA